ncbi:hypothetical protein LTR47_005798 [Exophiala xenobiotica]|nr:hypothetical protein LTR47_005798 [Exophiala xenobiotica]KAK5241862.1 hypothetical protein LTS06_011878 [Exophiala xenobiotica]KAK5260036.1 hypothetical protein LTR40_004871 [Exophiala xenobiotica]KAK5351024.1 hypothetical protein LTR61_005377 [Exophiala xenobiotica]KAK5374004.1 hypothetical protein LTS03_006159 [Exophiala xenobiotica]
MSGPGKPSKGSNEFRGHASDAPTKSKLADCHHSPGRVQKCDSDQLSLPSSSVSADDWQDMLIADRRILMRWMKKGKSKTNSTAMQGVEERNAASDEDDTRDIMTGVNPFLNIPGFPASYVGQIQDPAPGAQDEDALDKDKGKDKGKDNTASEAPKAEAGYEPSWNPRVQNGAPTLDQILKFDFWSKLVAAAHKAVRGEETPWRDFDMSWDLFHKYLEQTDLNKTHSQILTWWRRTGQSALENNNGAKLDIFLRIIGRGKPKGMHGLPQDRNLESDRAFYREMLDTMSKDMAAFMSTPNRQKFDTFKDDVTKALDNHLRQHPSCQSKESVPVQAMTEWIQDLTLRVEYLRTITTGMLTPCLDRLRFAINESQTPDILMQEQGAASADLIECHAKCESRHVELCLKFKTLVMLLYAATHISQVPYQKATFCHIWRQAHHALFEALQVKDQKTLLSPEDL